MRPPLSALFQYPLYVPLECWQLANSDRAIRIKKDGAIARSRARKYDGRKAFTHDKVQRHARQAPADEHILATTVATSRHRFCIYLIKRQLGYSVALPEAASRPRHERSFPASPFFTNTYLSSTYIHAPL